jgi:hypothetical protein
MATAFSRDQLLAAFDEIGHAAADFDAGLLDIGDVPSLLRVLKISDVEQAIAVMAEFFPKSAAAADKQRFVLKRILSAQETTDAPRYPCPGL